MARSLMALTSQKRKGIVNIVKSFDYK